MNSNSEIARIFLRLGLLGFGGPIALIRLMEIETVEKRRWFKAENFSSMYAMVKLLPGPIAVQMAIWLGMERGGRKGGIIAGISMVFPSFLLLLVLSYIYFHLGARSELSGFLGGMQLGTLAVILISVIGLSTPYRRSIEAWVIALISAVLIQTSPSLEPFWILLAGAYGVLKDRHASKPHLLGSLSPAPILALASAATSAPDLTLGTLWKLFWLCFKGGAFVFGTAIAIIPMLEGDAVQKYGWLTHAQFMDGIALGQVSPGPFSITVVFIGFKVAGILGSSIAALGIYLPAFLNILFIVPRIWKRVQGHPALHSFVSRAMPSIIGCILGAVIHLGYPILGTPTAALISLAALVLGLRFSLPNWMLIPGAGALFVLLNTI